MYQLKDNLSFEGEIDRVGKNFEFKVTLQYGYYIGIGFGLNMTGAPIVILDDKEGDKQTIPVIRDTYSKGWGPPGDNEENFYKLISAKAGEDAWELIIQRPIVLQREERDETIQLDQELRMIYAYKEGYGEHELNQRGFFNMIINSKTQVAEFDTVVNSTDFFYKMHGILFYVSWSIMTFALLVSGRYIKHLYNFRMIIHTAIGLLLAANTTILVILSLTSFNKGTYDYKAHKPIGIAVMVASIIQCFGGFSLKRFMATLVYNTKFTRKAKLGHQIFGLLLIILSNFQVVTGLYRINSPVRNLIYVHFAAFIAMIATAEVIYRLRFRYKGKGFSVDKNVPLYSSEEFRNMARSGKKVVLFNDYILDIGSFISEHPGGSHFMKANIGKDVGKYFYGVSSMENGILPYEHSNYAGKIIAKMVIGKLESKYAGEQSLRTSLNGTKSVETSITTPLSK